MWKINFRCVMLNMRSENIRGMIECLKLQCRALLGIGTNLAMSGPDCPFLLMTYLFCVE